VFVGSLLSSSAPDRYIRPVITFVIAASGLKYVGVGTEALGLDSLYRPPSSGQGRGSYVRRPWRKLDVAPAQVETDATSNRGTRGRRGRHSRVMRRRLPKLQAECAGRPSGAFRAAPSNITREAGAKPNS